MSRASGILRILVISAASLAMLSPAGAQMELGRPGASDGRGVEEIVRPPDIEDPASAPVWLYYLVGVASIAVCLGLAVFPSRREFND